MSKLSELNPELKVFSEKQQEALKMILELLEELEARIEALEQQ